MSEKGNIDKFLLDNKFGQVKKSKIQLIFDEIKDDKYNFSEKSGIDFEINCLGDISFKKYIQNIYDKVELLEIFREIKEKGYNNSNSQHHKEINDLKEFLEKNPGQYNELEKKLEKKVSAKVIYIMNNRHKLFPLIKEDEFEEIAEIVEKSQKREEFISDPATNFANDLHASLAIALNLDNFDDLEYYCSTKTHLDAFAIDAWFKYKYIDENNQEKSIRVFFDLTSKTEKQKKIEYKEKEDNDGTVLSDLILSMPEKERYSRNEDKHYINLFTKKIKEEINKKITAP